MNRIDLAHAAPFRIGILDVRPDLRQVTDADGAPEIVEPRVMQVLVALTRAQGAVVSRDDLTHSCWEGRVVGEDAINRVIARLRRLAGGIGANSFTIETVTRVGYRLVPTPGTSEAVADPATPAAPRRTRRTVLVGGAIAATAAIGGGGFLLSGFYRHPGPPPSVAPLMEQAKSAIGQSSLEGTTQAIGLLRRVTEIAPDYADGWGLLAMSYAAASNGRA